jgi:tetratricopeptide (TPR) repeat protein
MKAPTRLFIVLVCYYFFMCISIHSKENSNILYDEHTIQQYQNLYLEDPHNLKNAEDYAYVLAYTHKDAEALEIYHHILQLDPTRINVLNNIALVLTRSGHTKDAIRIYKQALTHQDNALVHLNLAIAYLTDGDLAHGFREYEWRWRALNETYTADPHTWNGYDNLDGKRICIHAEQGLGDTFMCIRYLVLLKNMGAHVIFVTQPALRTLLQQCPYIDTLCSFDEPIPEYDYFCLLLSLPHVFKTQLDTVPTTIPYLYAHKELIKTWRKKIKSEKQYKVGICWQGNIVNEETSKKSCALEQFKPLAEIPGIALYSIQKLEHSQDTLPSDAFVHIFNPPLDEEQGNFMDTAALIKNLDLVITIDTSIAHLSAALGTPTWILLAKPCDWRWMKKTTHTPWYPNVRLFRQQTPGDWTEVMHAVAQALQELVDSGISTCSNI